MAAETLALVDAAEALFWLSIEISRTARKLVVLPDCYIDSKQLHEALYLIPPVLDKRLRIVIGILHEMLENKEINSAKWISSEEQLINCLTKRGA